MVARIGWTLLHSLWEGALIAAVLAVALSLLGRRSAQARYSASLLAMACMLIAFAVTFTIAPAAKVVTAVRGSPASSTALDRSMSSSIVQDTSDAVPASAPTTPAQLTWKEVAPQWFAAGWLIGVALLGLCRSAGWVCVQRLRAIKTEPVDPSILDTARRIARQLDLSAPFEVLLSHFTSTPMVIGWLRPVILIPAGIITGLTPSQLEGILAHELAHIRRHDYLVNLLQVLAETLLFYHPAVWWLSRQVRLEREQACDDIALSLCGDRCEYASSLAALEALRFAPALAARGSGGRELIARIRRIVGSDDTTPPYGAAGVLSLILIAGTAAAVYSQVGGNPPAATTQPFNLKNNTPRLSPFTAVRWRGDVPEAEFKGDWYEVVSINDVPAAKILNHLASSGDFASRKHFAEDLVEVLTGMGNPPGRTVKLDLRTVDGHKPLQVPAAEMTEENRSSVLKYDSEHPEAVVSQPAASSGDLFRFDVPFKLGTRQFLDGDSITITRVKGTNPDMEGGICCISGTYILASHDKATLAASVTASDAKDGVGPWNSSQTFEIQKGKGEFTLLLPISIRGWPHVSFYGIADKPDGIVKRKIEFLRADLATQEATLVSNQKMLDELSLKYGTADLAVRDQAIQSELAKLEGELTEAKIARDDAVANSDAAVKLANHIDHLKKAIEETRQAAMEVGAQRQEIENTRAQVAEVHSKMESDIRHLEQLSEQSTTDGMEPTKDAATSSFGGVYLGTGVWVLQR
jgi:beta-lactamase regulating signal transducer with metallopeptidase domain